MQVPSDRKARHAHEEWSDLVLQACLGRRRGAFIDIGANTGQTFLKVRHMLRGPYLGFEPQIEGAAEIARLLRGSPGIEGAVLCLALSDRDGLVRLRRRPLGATQAADATACMIEGFRPATFYAEEIWAPASVGDAVIATATSAPVATIKIDAEGAELEVVRGLVCTLAKYQPVVLFEVLNHFLLVGRRAIGDDLMAFRNERVAALEQHMRGLGYLIGVIRSSGQVEMLDRIRPCRARHQRETMFIAAQPSHLSCFSDLVVP